MLSASLLLILPLRRAHRALQLLCGLGDLSSGLYSVSFSPPEPSHQPSYRFRTNRACMARFSSQQSLSGQLALKWRVENEGCAELYTNLFLTISLVLGLLGLSAKFFTELCTQPATHTNLLLRCFDWFSMVLLPSHDCLCPPSDRVNSSKC